MKVIVLITILLTAMRGFADASATNADNPEAAKQQCPSAELFSDVTYEDLRNKLDKTLKEKNKSLVFLDFKSLQAQIDIISNHLISEDVLSSEQAEMILKKTIAYLDQLNALIAKSKETAKLIKENHVVPLATLTSLKSEADSCNASVSPYSDIFKTLSTLNKDLNEILMISQHKVAAQKEKVQLLLRQLDESQEISNVSIQAISENLNFMQRHINSITTTFEFDSKVLQVATHD